MNKNNQLVDYFYLFFVFGKDVQDNFLKMFVLHHWIVIIQKLLLKNYFWSARKWKLYIWLVPKQSVIIILSTECIIDLLRNIFLLSFTNYEAHCGQENLSKYLICCRHKMCWMRKTHFLMLYDSLTCKRTKCQNWIKWKLNLICFRAESVRVC